jgi:NMD protein affecting ribosome stability and mRNA decay
MKLFCRLSRKHYWSTPHRSTENRLVQMCYECGAERTLNGFEDNGATERLNEMLASARNDLAKMRAERRYQSPQTQIETVETIRTGTGPLRILSLVK